MARYISTAEATVNSFSVHPSMLVPKRQPYKPRGEAKKNTHTLRPEIREWLKVSTTRHWFLKQAKDGKMTIHFTCQKDAFYYKLTWYGTEELSLVGGAV